jgi:unsaturated rhamnogalacturonyl hydrolase
MVQLTHSNSRLLIILLAMGFSVFTPEIGIPQETPAQETPAIEPQSIEEADLPAAEVSRLARNPERVILDILAYQEKTQPSHKRDWNWEDAIYLHSIGLVGETTDHPLIRKEIIESLSTFANTWASKKKLPKITMGDRCPAVLSILSLRRLLEKDGQGVDPDRYAKLIQVVSDYLKNSPRNQLGALDHLGKSWFRSFYPDSIWVDSLVMTGVTSVWLGQYANDPELIEFGAAQPEIYASVLQDPGFQLFRHAWFVNRERPFPKSETFWLRGNGWVVWSMVELLERLPLDHPKRPGIQQVLNTLSAALLKYQKPSGRWDTIANLPGYAYEETSGTAIIASHWLKAVRLGLLPEWPYRAAALKAWEGVVAKLHSEKEGLSVRGISGPTNPSGRLAYKWILKKKDAAYGVGPVLLLAEEVRLSQKK